MPYTFYIALIFVVIIILIIRFFRKKNITQPQETTQINILKEHVVFYQHLSKTEQRRFVEAMREFLSRVTVTGVKTEVDEMDKTFIGAAAIIPVFRFPNWKYHNIHEVLIYPESFDHENFTQTGADRHTLGVVGNGPLQNVMILSRHDLRNGFMNHTDKNNTAVHEFVHLVDKDDGAVDGVPDTLLPHQYSKPWLQLIHKEIAAIVEGDSDINPYGSTNEAEFFAVASEYFFEQPELMQEKHPELYSLIEKVFMSLE